MLKNVNKSAFTLIEIVVVIAIAVSLMAVATRFLFLTKPEAKISNIVDSFNNVVFLTKQNVFVSGKRHRFVISKAELKVQIEKGIVGSNKIIFEDLVSPYLKTKYVFPQNFNLHMIYSGGKRLEDDRSGFYCIDISRNGILPFVFIQFSLEDSKKGSQEKFTLRSQPFLGYFELENDWVKE